MSKEWIKDETLGDAEWRRTINSDNRGVVSGCLHSSEMHWQTWRGDNVLSGIESSINSAMEKADEALSLPLGAFNDLVLSSLYSELNKLETQISKIQPAKYSSRFYAGYKKGSADTKRRIMQTINEENPAWA